MRQMPAFCQTCIAKNCTPASTLLIVLLLAITSTQLLVSCANAESDGSIPYARRWSESLGGKYAAASREVSRSSMIRGLYHISFSGDLTPAEGRRPNGSPGGLEHARRVARMFFAENQSVLGLDILGVAMVEIGAMDIDLSGKKQVRYSLCVDNVPLFGAEIRTNFDREGIMNSLSGALYELTENQAMDIRNALQSTTLQREDIVSIIAAYEAAELPSKRDMVVAQLEQVVRPFAPYVLWYGITTHGEDLRTTQQYEIDGVTGEILRAATFKR